MEKLFAVLALFRKGNAVADPALWKNGSITVMAIVPVLLALVRVAQAFGVDVQVSDADANAIALGIVSLVGVFSHVITSEKVGLPPVSPSDPADRPADGFRDRGP
jgi:uncharacterized membrane protein